MSACERYVIETVDGTNSNLFTGLYLVAFGSLRSVFSGHELRGLADTMAERGLRLRRGLDEVLEGWEIGDDDFKGDESDESADEIEHNAKELRRLMPY